MSVHAAATDVEVILAFAPRTLKLTVIDDGRGFDMAAIYQNSNGHLGLIERAESLGGRVTIQSQLTQGTRVELIVPVPTDETNR